MTPGQELKRAREAMGLSLSEVSDRTRIPPRYLEAIENDDHAAFPSGPFRVGFTKKYRALVAVPDRPVEQEPMVTVTSPAHPSSRTRRRALTLGALGATVALGGFVLINALGGAVEPTASIGEPMDLTVTVDVEESVRLRVFRDGERIFAEAFKPEKRQAFEGRDRLVLELDTLIGVELTFQGRPLKPLGLQSRPRRLVFIDDGG